MTAADVWVLYVAQSTSATVLTIDVNWFLTHWGRVTHICVSKLTIIGSDNGLSPGRRQAIIWTNAGILIIGPWGTHFSKNSIEILTFSFTKMRLKVSSAKWRPFCLGLNVLTTVGRILVTCSISVLRNDRKYKYISMFPQLLSTGY